MLKLRQCLLPLGAALLAALAQPALATTVAYVLTPDNTQIGFTIYAIGVFPLRASYQRFSGTLVLDTADAGYCDVDVLVDSTSMHMASAARTERAMQADMMDTAEFPTLRFTGSCRGTPGGSEALVGNITLHGVTRPLTLARDRHGDMIVSSGTLHRYDFGVNGMPGQVGREIGLKFSTKLPPEPGTATATLP